MSCSNMDIHVFMATTIGRTRRIIYHQLATEKGVKYSHDTDMWNHETALIINGFFICLVYFKMW